MNNAKTLLPIGIFDSGIGGITVLAEIIKILPCEQFIYFADTLHSPYGTKPEETVRTLSIHAANFLSQLGIKAMVVACNTATGAAINELRKICDFPVIGMEPAIKPAVELGRRGKILVMATPLTLNSRKFNELSRQYQPLTEIVPLPCKGLVEIIEQGSTHKEKITDYLTALFASINKENVSAIVLGCTHYVLIKKEIIKLLGNDVAVIDGNYGTAKRLKNILQMENLLRPAHEDPSRFQKKIQVQFYLSDNSDNKEKEIKKCRAIFAQLLQNDGIVCE